ncbi:hypothetical protein BU23DRAFT_205845 [Bimuria novae-zelandiae CBS 107.79]|uniref:Uncharacterized protein n=1 Tax=Bimuria novae-zelandiae CBS 107.79 TaxID=1447943 RepID=A0A6A5V3L4_9PLEO|nr:hypothetical protein BU23DRAFT_205845 [Bimuria novae-zelandiae CBS 107.79]
MTCPCHALARFLSPEFLWYQALDLTARRQCRNLPVTVMRTRSTFLICRPSVFPSAGGTAQPRTQSFQSRRNMVRNTWIWSSPQTSFRETERVALHLCFFLVQHYMQDAPASFSSPPVFLETLRSVATIAARPCRSPAEPRDVEAHHSLIG